MYQILNKINEKFDPWELELENFYLFPKTKVVVSQNDINNFIALYENIKDDEYYEIKVAVVRKHKLNNKFEGEVNEQSK
ncbi:MAG: hypothetical protein QXU40_01410 [Candidatus Pacearchaeota archaeon]